MSFQSDHYCRSYVALAMAGELSVMRLQKSTAVAEKDRKGWLEMIVRLWHGRTNISKADEYAEFMKERAAPDYASIGGLKKLYFLR